MFTSNNVHRFTCGENKIWLNIRESENIMKMICCKTFYLHFMSLLRAKFPQDPRI